MCKYYRFLTNREKTEKFGVHWRSSYKYGWGDSMNFLLGQPLYMTLPSPLPSIFSYKGYTLSPMSIVEVKDGEMSQAILDHLDLINFYSSDGYITSLPSTDSFKILTKSGYSVTISIIESPTGNCQLSSIGCFNNLLDVLSISEIEAVFFVLRSKGYINKRLFLIDVNESYISQLKEKLYSKGCSYVSTNGSSMHYGIIKFD